MMRGSKVLETMPLPLLGLFTVAEPEALPRPLEGR
jgi:hypothetical protein